jgi:hypothetical protein
MNPMRHQAVLCAAAALALAACATDTPADAETPVPGAGAAAESAPAEEPTAEDLAESSAPAPSALAEGLRLPDMLSLPGENQFRATNPIPAANRDPIPRLPSQDPAAPLIVRPPLGAGMDD